MRIVWNKRIIYFVYGWKFFEKVLLMRLEALKSKMFEIVLAELEKIEVKGILPKGLIINIIFKEIAV